MPLTNEQKEKVKLMRIDGKGYKAIANEIGVSRDQVRSYCVTVGLVGINVILFEVSCEECGVTFNQKISGQKFCSNRCRGRHNKRNNGPERKCFYCEKAFNSYRDKKYCSNKCHESHVSSIRTMKQIEKDAQRKDKEVTKLVNCLHNILARTKTCSHCKKEFILQKNVSGHKYCSDECKAEGYRIIRRKHKRKNRLNKDKRWTTNGKMDYSITLDKLHKRDEGICYLCNEPTDYNDFVITDTNAFIAGNNYPSIDHVLPIAKGGLHSWDNIKLAHRICNSIKRDKLII